MLISIIHTVLLVLFWDPQDSNILKINNSYNRRSIDLTYQGVFLNKFIDSLKIILEPPIFFPSFTLVGLPNIRISKQKNIMLSNMITADPIVNLFSSKKLLHIPTLVANSFNHIKHGMIFHLIIVELVRYKLFNDI